MGPGSGAGVTTEKRALILNQSFGSRITGQKTANPGHRDRLNGSHPLYQKRPKLGQLWEHINMVRMRVAIKHDLALIPHAEPLRDPDRGRVPWINDRMNAR